jgi:hypothetical protein
MEVDLSESSLYRCIAKYKSIKSIAPSRFHRCAIAGDHLPLIFPLLLLSSERAYWATLE